MVAPRVVSREVATQIAKPSSGAAATEGELEATRLTRAPARVAPTADDSEYDRSVRVFVSSTFLDMQAERRELATKVFPALRAKYRARGVELFEVDLRWGITKEQQERGETLPTLLAEIDRCRPYFIGLLGERYGWVPPQAALTDKLKADYPVLASAQGASVTAFEVMHALLSDPDTAARACFFERDPSWNWRGTLSEAERAEATDEGEVGRVKLAELKSLVRKKAKVHPYARPDELGQTVTQVLDALLEARFPEVDAPDLFEQTARMHRAYARERRTLHIGAESYIQNLNSWAENNDASALLITGFSGAGKSTLIANWLHVWRKAHPKDIIFEHYIGASEDSADPMLIMRRLFEHLNRATGEVVDLPGENAELMDFSAALTQRLARVRLIAERDEVRILIALDGLDKLSSGRNLLWLPMPPGVRVLASSLDGEPAVPALARGFAQLDVKSLDQSDRRDFIAGTLARWRRQLTAENIESILQPAAANLAGSPLYLKTVLEELRVSADHARLTERLEDYRGARDMSDLFERVLARLERDCEPGFAAEALALIWAGRAGLEEAEIVAITGASPLAWATLRNGLGDALSNQGVRITITHEFLRSAVEARYLETDDKKSQSHLRVANRFRTNGASTERQAEEVPYQLCEAHAWDELQALLSDFDQFASVLERSNIELHKYWLPLRQRGCNYEEVICTALLERLGDVSTWSSADIALAAKIVSYLRFSDAKGEPTRRLIEQCVGASKAVFGQPLHFATELAGLHKDRGEFQLAEKILQREFEGLIQISGPQSEDTLKCLTNAAALALSIGAYGDAKTLLDYTIPRFTVSLGRNNPVTLTAVSNLAAALSGLGLHDRALTLRKALLEITAQTFGPDDPTTLVAISNLAESLYHSKDLEPAYLLLARASEAAARTLGVEHKITLTIANNLASLLRVRGELAEAEELQERVVSINTHASGPEHPETLLASGNLALIYWAKGDFARAAELQEHVLQTMLRVLGEGAPAAAMVAKHLEAVRRSIPLAAYEESLQRRQSTSDGD